MKNKLHRGNQRFPMPQKALAFCGYVLLFAVIFIALLPMVFAETDAPILTITQPKGEYFTQNLPYNNLNITFNWTEANPDSCWYGIDNYTEQTTPNETACGGSFDSPCSNAYDGDWDTFANISGASAGIYTNYTILTGYNQANITYRSKGYSAAPILIYYFNYSINSWALADNEGGDPGPAKFRTFVIPSNVMQNKIQIRVNIEKDGVGRSPEMYESKIKWIKNPQFSDYYIIPSCTNNSFNISTSGSYSLQLYQNDTFGNIGSKTSSFSINLYNTSSRASKGNVTEGEAVTFTFQINSTNITSINATFYYNNSAYNYGTKQTSAYQANFTKILNIPTGSGNIPFYWNYTLNDAFNNLTDKKNITVSSISMTVGSGCANGMSVAFNFTFASEINLTSMTEDSVNYNFLYGTTNNSEFKAYGSLNNINSFVICINATITNNYSVGYGEIDYQTSGFTERRFYIMQNQRATNVTGNIVLHNLISTAATSFLFNAKDSALNPYAGIYLALLRWYPENNTYLIVEMGKTNDLGTTVMRVQADVTDYRVALYQIDGTLIKLTEPSRISCIETPCTYSISVPSSEGEYSSIYGIESSVTQTYSDTLTFVWNDPSQLTDSMTFYVYKDNGYTKETICNDTYPTYVGVAPCNFSGYAGMIGYIGYRTASPMRPIIKGFLEMREKFDSAMSMIIQFCISMIVGFIAIFSPVAAIAFGVVGFVIGYALGAISFQILIAIGIIGGIIIHFIGRSGGR